MQIREIIQDRILFKNCLNKRYLRKYKDVKNERNVMHCAVIMIFFRGHFEEIIEVTSVRTNIRYKYLKPNF